jgi:Asp-tRNA(Asn)/Glu-tRNA(Gln) amidotransferase A subunit family amidase
MAKTNLPEFAYWIESDNLLTGRTNNPWDLDRSAGGSSGGESAAIAPGMSPLGIGSDLSISLRGPAADTGIVGFKPTRGRVPMTGAWPREPRRDWHAGPMAPARSATSHWRIRCCPVLTAPTVWPPSRARSTPASVPHPTGPSASAGWSTRR